eukprot:22652-Chlamydomonas_euryale.AAC.3
MTLTVPHPQKSGAEGRGRGLFWRVWRGRTAAANDHTKVLAVFGTFLIQKQFPNRAQPRSQFPKPCQHRLR